MIPTNVTVVGSDNCYHETFEPGDGSSYKFTLVHQPAYFDGFGPEAGWVVIAPRLGFSTYVCPGVIYPGDIMYENENANWWTKRATLLWLKKLSENFGLDFSVHWDSDCEKEYGSIGKRPDRS